MEVSVPLAALSERTSSHNLETGAERHLGFGFGSIQYLKHPQDWSDDFKKEFEQMEKYTELP
jgi:hypothetical protein